MAPPFSELLHSKMFTFLIGEQETPVVVHSGAISSLSRPLNCLINGSMKEAQNNVAKFESLEVEDFDHICEFGYRGDYTAPKPVVVNLPQNEHSSNHRSVTHWVDMLQIQTHELDYGKTRAPPIGREALIQNFLSRNYMGASVPAENIRDYFDPLGNTSTAAEFGPVLLAYARLYVLGEHWEIGELKEVTLRKLHYTLSKFTVSLSSRGAVIKLARFVYNNLAVPDRRVTGRIDKLRDLVIEFIAMRLEIFRLSQEHRELLDEGSEYAGDLMDAVQKWRLN
jgi:hypothetical protein